MAQAVQPLVQEAGAPLLNYLQRQGQAWSIRNEHSFYGSLLRRNAGVIDKLCVSDPGLCTGDRGNSFAGRL